LARGRAISISINEEPVTNGGLREIAVGGGERRLEE